MWEFLTFCEEVKLSFVKRLDLTIDGLHALLVCFGLHALLVCFGILQWFT